MDTPNRLLVVGGTGFIGRHVVQQALNLGWQVSNLSLRPVAEADLPGVRCVSVDLTEREKVKAVLDGDQFEYVVNCGGYINHAPYFAGGAEIFDAHFQGLLNLLEYIDRSSLKRFVNFGSSDEYGNAEAPQVETYREAPISPYSMAKVAASHFLQMLYRTEGIPTVTLRLFLTYGPRQGDKRFLPQIIRGCLEGRSFPVSLGEQVRDFCYVQDTVEAVFAALQSDTADGEVFNIASGQPVSICQMIETVQRLVGSGTPCFGEVPYRSGENMALYADISKARRLLGWQPSVSLEGGISNTIQWVMGLK